MKEDVILMFFILFNFLIFQNIVKFAGTLIVRCWIFQILGVFRYIEYLGTLKVILAQFKSNLARLVVQICPNFGK